MNYTPIDSHFRNQTSSSTIHSYLFTLKETIPTTVVLPQSTAQEKTIFFHFDPLYISQAYIISRAYRAYNTHALSNERDPLKSGSVRDDTLI